MRLPVGKRTRFAPWLVVAAMLALAAPGAMAQSVMDEAARQAEEIERENSADREAERLRSIRRTFRAPSAEEPEAPLPVPSGPGTTCLEVKHIRVDGVALLDPSEIRKTVARWEGKCLDLTAAGNVLVANILENIDNTGTMTASDLLLRVGRQLTNRGRLFGSNKVAIDGKDAGFVGEVINASKAVINGGGQLYVAADKLWNAGSMGSANGSLEFRASGNIVNERGLFYSKGNSLFQVGRDFVNIHGDVTSEQGMTIKGLLNPRAAALWNEAGTIQAVRGNLTIDAEQVNNKRVPLVVDVRSSTTVRNKPVKRDIYRGNSKTTITTTRERGRVSGTPAKILAGGNMTINASGVTNSYSQIAAGGALTIHAGTVVNEGRDLLQTVNTETTTQFSELYCKRRVLGVCLKKKKNNWSETTHDKKVSVIGSIFGTIQAGGALVVQAAGYTKNIAIRSNAGALNLSANGKAMSAVAAPASVVVPKIADPSPLEFSIQSVLGRPAIFQQAG